MNPPTAHLSHQVDVGAGPAFIHSLLHSFHCSIHHSSIHSTDPPACQSTHPFFHLLIHSSIPPPLHPSSIQGTGGAFSIDSEEYEAMPVEVKLLPRKLQFFCDPRKREQLLQSPAQ